ncbi:radical SAM additional 4Fe4S-binding SPASM domain-containing protein [Lachnospiraceae bacterium XBB2008]|nr:radical SAM additional 4Fe4S-binding SPASM domain-containing protein [Lachnospiraceae bacterium XBB2008]
MEVKPIILLNNSCNFRCCHCYVRNATDETPIDTIIKFFDNIILANNADFVRFAGGEPFLYSHFHELALFLCKMRDKGIDLNFTTNGSCITDSIMNDLQIIQPNMVKVSLLSLRENKYNEIIGSNHKLSDTIMAIEQLMKSFTVGINMTIMKDTICDVEPLIQFCLSNGIKDLFFSQLTPAGRGFVIENKKLSKEEIDYVHTIIDSVDKNKINITYDDGCHCGFYEDFVLNWDGDIFPCSALVSYPEYKIGDCDSTVDEMRKKINELCKTKSKVCFVEDFVKY